MRNGQELFRTLLDNSTDAIFVSDLDYRLLYVNMRACKSLGFSKEELLKMRIKDVDPEYTSSRLDDLWAKLTFERTIIIESRHRRKDGSLFPVEINIGKLEIDGRPAILGLARDISDRKRVEKELHKNIARLNEVQQIAHLGHWELDLVSGTLSWSDEVYRIFEMLPHEVDISYELFLSYVHPDDRQSVEQAYKESVEKKSAYNIVHRVLLKDGIVKYVNERGKTEYDLDGRALVSLGTILDITERIQAEENIWQSEERFRAILDNLDALVYIADMQTYEILFLNKYGRDVWGDIVGKTCWQNLQTGQSGPCRFCTNDKLLNADGKPSGVCVWELQNTKNYQWYECRDQAIRWLDGRFVRMEIATDITARKQAEKDIYRAQREWERTFDAIADPITIQDDQMRIVRVNQAACQILQTAKEDLIGKFCHEVLCNSAIPCDECPEGKSMQKDSNSYSMEVFNEKLRKTFLFSISRIFDEDGQFQGLVHVAKDITEQRQLEGRLRQAQKMEAIGTLAGGIAHDFNNILTPILGYTEMALQSVASDSRTAKDLQEVLVASKRATELVKQIRTFSLRTEQQLKPLKIQFIIKEVLKLLRAAIPSTIELKENIDHNCGAVLADPTQIHQIVMNLCTNAYQAMPETGGQLGVTLTQVELGPDAMHNKLLARSGTYVRMEISDTGYGMDKEVLEKIFDPYFTTKRDKGTGLGLAVVHGIVKNFGGDITVYSEPGKGTTFRIYFPLIDSEIKAPVSGPPALLPMGTERILVVDDEESIARFEEQLFVSLGYHVSIFTNPEEAIKAFRSQPQEFDLIFSDMIMPKRTGLELAREIHSLRPDIPIIICTGFAEVNFQEDMESAGISKFIMKPILRNDLAYSIREVLDGTDGNT